jgi:HK97 family phage major capsid protein
MNKKMRDLLSKINSKKELVKSYMDGETKDVEKASSILDEIDELEKEYAIEEKLYKMEKEENEPSEEEIKDKDEKSVTKAFANGVRGLISKDFSGNNETTNADGGYTVPQDIVTKVEKLREVEESLIDLVTVKKVNTLSGRETYKKKGQYTGFSSIGEGGKIPKKGKVEFAKLDWKVTKYGGYMPVTNELLEDSDEDIEALMIEWLANESRVTRNNIILAVIAEKETVDLENMDGIKKAVTVTLGSAYKNSSVIITNDDGLNYLDTLKDENGRPMLNPDPTDNAKLALRCGTVVVPVKAFSNETIPSDETKAPFIIGDLKEAIKFFDRKSISLMVSNTATVGTGNDALNAFDEDLTLIRGIEREDAEMRDEDAFVNGYIDLASAESNENDSIEG